MRSRSRRCRGAGVPDRCGAAGALLAAAHVVGSSSSPTATSPPTSSTVSCPGAFWSSQSIRAGQLPLWTSQICSGYPLVGAPADPLRARAVRAAAARRRARSAAHRAAARRSARHLCAGATAWRRSKRRGARRPRLSPGPATSRLQLATPLDHVHGRLASGRPAPDRPRHRIAWPAERRRSCSWPRWDFSSQTRCSPAFRKRPTSAAWSTARSRSSARSRIGSDAVRSATWLPLLVGLAGALMLGAAAGAVVLLPLLSSPAVSDRAGTLGYKWATLTELLAPEHLQLFHPLHLRRRVGSRVSSARRRSWRITATSALQPRSSPSMAPGASGGGRRWPSSSS